MPPRRLLTTFLAAACLVPAAVSGQVLRYRGVEGERLRYRLANTVRIHQDVRGVATDVTVRSRALLDLVLESSSRDTLTYTLTFDSLTLDFEGAPIPSPDLSAVVGRKMALKLSPRGRVHAFELPEDMPQTPGFDLKQMVGHFFPRLPVERAEAGATWADTLDYPVAQQGIESEIRVITSYTSRGETRSDAGTFLEVAYTTATTIRGRGEQAGAPLFLDGNGSGQGTILLGRQGETFWASKGTQTLELVVDVTPEGQPPMSIPVRQEITAEIQRL